MDGGGGGESTLPRAATRTFAITSDAAIVTALDSGHLQWQVALGRDYIDEVSQDAGGSIDDFPTPAAALDAITTWAKSHGYVCDEAAIRELVTAEGLDSGELAVFELLSAIPLESSDTP